MRKSYLLLLLLVHSTVFAYTKDKVYSITILHTNDHHGNFWQNSKGEYGLAARATLIKKLREEIQNAGGHVLLVDAGDVNTGVPQSDLLKAEPDFRGMGMIGYDVMALGNHEFDNDLAILMQQQMWAGFPFISANVYSSVTHERLFPSHITKQLDDLNFTIMGLTTEDTPLKSKFGGSLPIYFNKAVDEAKKLVPKLKKESDVLMALTHMGHHYDEHHGLDAPGDVTLARQVNGIDIIVGGHTQKPLFKPDVQNGTIIVQAEDWGKYVGRIDLEFLNGVLTLKHYELIPVNYQVTTATIAEDTDMLDLLRPFKELGDATLLIDIGFSLGDFDGDRAMVRTQETNLGNLVSFVYKDKLKADIGLTNGGGIRASLPAGKLTYASVLTVMPFANEIGRAKLSGRDLKEYLSFLILEFGPGTGIQTGSFPHFSGVRATVDRSLKTVSEIKINGEDLDEERIYSIALSNFLAGGGDKYPKLLDFQVFGFVDADLFRSFIEERAVLTPESFAVTNYITVK
jgi:5'-nucleotidase / UDP-sugar diphosphatase